MYDSKSDLKKAIAEAERRLAEAIAADDKVRILLWQTALNDFLGLRGK